MYPLAVLSHLQRRFFTLYWYRSKVNTCGEVEILHAGLLQGLIEVRDAADDANRPEHRKRCSHQPISDASHHVTAARGHLRRQTWGERNTTMCQSISTDYMHWYNMILLSISIRERSNERCGHQPISDAVIMD